MGGTGTPPSCLSGLLQAAALAVSLNLLNLLPTCLPAGAPAKRHEPAPVPPPAMPRAGPPRDTIFRLVVNVVDTALIIGKGGATVRQIESETGEEEAGRPEASVIRPFPFSNDNNLGACSPSYLLPV